MFKSIVLGTDGSPHADKATKVAADIAGRYGARLLIVNAFTMSLTYRELENMPQAQRLTQEDTEEIGGDWEALVEAEHSLGPAASHVPGIEAALKAVTVMEKLSDEITADAEKIAKDNGAKDTVRISVNGDPAGQIVEQAKEHDCDLIVLGTRGLSDFSGLVMGSVSHKVVHMAECPCLLVK